jgi:hypothetical protein
MAADARRLVGKNQGAQKREQAWVLATVSYSLVSGFVALAVGAVASFAASGMSKLTLWFTVTAVTAVAAGIAYDSRLIRNSRIAVTRWFH